MGDDRYDDWNCYDLDNEIVFKEGTKYVEEIPKINNNIEKLMNIINNFSEKEIEQVLIFVEFLEYKRKNRIEEITDKVINKNMDALKELSKY